MPEHSESLLSSEDDVPSASWRFGKSQRLPGYNDNEEEEGVYDWALDKANSITADTRIRDGLAASGFGVLFLA